MARKLKLDMTGVESFTRCPEGVWVAKLKKIEEIRTQGGDDALKAQFEVIKDEAAGCSVFETFSLAEKALWKLKTFLESVGQKASGKISLDLDKLEGKVCMIDVIHEEYNGQNRAKISAYSKLVSSSEEEDEEEEDLEEEEEEEVKPSKKKKPEKDSKKKKKSEPEEEDEEDEEEEEEVKPSKKAKPAKKSAKKPEPEEEEDEEDEEDDWEEDDE